MNNQAKKQILETSVYMSRGAMKGKHNVTVWHCPTDSSRYSFSLTYGGGVCNFGEFVDDPYLSGSYTTPQEALEAGIAEVKILILSLNMELGCFEKDALIEKLAKKFYAILGYVVREDYRMQSATHPQERACVTMAIFAVEEFESIENECSDEEMEKDESETDSTKKVIAWFSEFWKFGDREQIRSRVQDYIININYLSESKVDNLGKWTWEDFSSFERINKRYPMSEIEPSLVDWKKVGTFIHELFELSFYEDEELDDEEH